MHAVLRCPDCGRSLKVPAEMMGKTVKGPCGHAFVARAELAAPPRAEPPPSFPMACPHCGEKLRIPEAVRGKTVKCRKCAEPFAVPAAETAVAAAPAKPTPVAEAPAEEDEPRPARRRPRERDDDAEENEPRRRPRRKPARSSGGRTALMVTGAIVGVVLLVCGGVSYLGWQFFMGVQQAAKDFKNDIDKNPFVVNPPDKKGGPFDVNPPAGDGALHFNTPDEAMTAYVKAVLELDPATYQKIVAQDTNLRFDFKDRCDALRRNTSGYDETFLGKAVLNQTRGHWWDSRALLYPSQQIEPDKATVRVVQKDRYAPKRGQEAVKAFEFHKAGNGWYLSGSQTLGRAKEIKDLAQVPAEKVRPLVADPTKLQPLEFDLLADTRLPSPEEAKALLPKLAIGAEFDAQGKMKTVTNSNNLDNQALRCIYVLASPEFSSLTMIATPELGDNDLERLAKRLPGLRAFGTYNSSGMATQVTDKGLADFGKLTRLRDVDLHCPFVTDAGLAALAPLDQLETLSFEGSITDAALSHLGKLKGLAVLKLNRNRIAGPGLGHLKGMDKLFSLELVSNLLTGPGLEHLAALPKLQGLTLTDNRLGDEGLKGLAGATQLTNLILADNQISDTGLQHLKGLTKLRFLYLRDNQIQGTGLIHLKGMKDLESINLENNPLTDEALGILAQLPKLQFAYLTQSGNFSEAALAKLRRAVPQVRVAPAPK